MQVTESTLELIAPPISTVEGQPGRHTCMLRTKGTGPPVRLLGLARVVCLLFMSDINH